MRDLVNAVLPMAGMLLAILSPMLWAAFMGIVEFLFGPSRRPGPTVVTRTSRVPNRGAEPVG